MNKSRNARLEDPAVVNSFLWKIGYAQNDGSRKEQQDSVGFMQADFLGKPVLLAVLADGMGGMSDGALFSRTAVESHFRHFQPLLDRLKAPADISSRVLLSLVQQANRDAHAHYDEQNPGGTTLISALLIDHLLYYCSVGDSRICLFRADKPLQLNREHVLGAALDERAWMGYISFEDAEDNIFRNSLTSSVGEERIRRIDCPNAPLRLLAGDKIVLMSDGVYRALSEEEIAQDIQGTPSEAADCVISHVLRKKIPQQDNMSIMVIEIPC